PGLVPSTPASPSTRHARRSRVSEGSSGSTPGEHPARDALDESLVAALRRVPEHIGKLVKGGARESVRDGARVRDGAGLFHAIADPPHLARRARRTGLGEKAPEPRRILP